MLEHLVSPAVMPEWDQNVLMKEIQSPKTASVSIYHYEFDTKYELRSLSFWDGKSEVRTVRLPAGYIKFVRMLYSVKNLEICECLRVL